jgi:2-methylcitrate dehydratase PrpD
MNALSHVAAEQGTRTEWLAARILDVRWKDISPTTAKVAKQCMLDWIGVAVAARDEPLVKILVQEFANEPQREESTLVGHKQRVSASTAALINGAMSHALDFDDVIAGMGHPTVPVAPAALAIGEANGASGRDVLLAFILGVEAECRVARLMGPSHYADGWHSTATCGTFGAAASCAKLLGLDRGQLLHAIGLAGTQAAGLKSVFGTMAKPLHPGKSAQNGILAARLARSGFTSDTDILGSNQGFAATQSTSVNPAAMIQDPDRLLIVDALFKYHAACYLTHDSIEAAASLRREYGLKPEQIARVLVKVREGHLKVCNIQEPRTGLECKFSLRMTTALALSGDDTFKNELFSDDTAMRPDLVALRNKVVVEPTAVNRGSIVELELSDGRRLTQSADVGLPLEDLELQQAKLERKFKYLVEPILGTERAAEIIEAVRKLETIGRIDQLMAMCRP